MGMDIKIRGVVQSLFMVLLMLTMMMPCGHGHEMHRVIQLSLLVRAAYDDHDDVLWTWT